MLSCSFQKTIKITFKKLLDHTKINLKANAIEDFKIFEMRYIFNNSAIEDDMKKGINIYK